MANAHCNTAPNDIGQRFSPDDFAYSEKDQHRLWQVWIDTRTPCPVLELEVKYPRDTPQPADHEQQPKEEQSYSFRIAMGLTLREADRVKSALDRNMTEKNDLVLSKKSTELIKLAVPFHKGNKADDD